MPILKAAREVVREIRAKADGMNGVLVVDFTDAAQTSKIYGEYTRKMAYAAPEGLRYLGVALYGDKKVVNGLTGSLPLLR